MGLPGIGNIKATNTPTFSVTLRNPCKTTTQSINDFKIYRDTNPVYE